MYYLLRRFIKKNRSGEKEALSQLPSNFDITMLENYSHELYTQKPREIAKIINDWINKK